MCVRARKMGWVGREGGGERDRMCVYVHKDVTVHTAALKGHVYTDATTHGGSLDHNNNDHQDF